MLPDSFLDWWHTPWRAAIDAPAVYGQDALGHADGYALWCNDAGIELSLPQQFDPGWSMLANQDNQELLVSARLFGGIVAARAHAIRMSAQLSMHERKWCAGIASTQPLEMAVDVGYVAGDDIALLGLVELARRLQHDFRGLWPRLALQLENGLRSRAEQILYGLPRGKPLPGMRPAALIRAQRCWQICQRQARQQGRPSIPADQGESG
jgi:hypothetical protein